MPQTRTDRSHIIQSGSNFPTLDHLPALVRRFYELNREASATFIRDESQRTDWLLKHAFHLEASTCIDGRVLDFPIAVGVPIGIMEMFRSAGAKVDFRTLSYARRCLDAVRKAQRMSIDGVEKTMATMRFLTVHYSASRPHDASCAAWRHQTNKALQAMARNAQYLNMAFPGRMVAFPVLVDTDLDALTVVGPNGSVSAYELLEDPKMMNGAGRSTLIARLSKHFPRTWVPLAELDQRFCVAFYEELAERLVANLQFVSQVIKSKRPIELLDHQERMVFVGRHADWITGHNTIFLIDDTDTDASVRASFVLALKYVARNVLRTAIETQDRDWSIPVVINVPHDDDDVALTRIYTVALETSLHAQLVKAEGNLHHWLTEHLVAGTQMKIPGWMRAQLVTIARRVRFYPSISYRNTRLFVPLH